MIKLKEFLLVFDKEETNVEIYEDFDKNRQVKNNNGMSVAIIDNTNIEDILKNRKINSYYVVNDKTQIWDENNKTGTLIIHVIKKHKLETEKQFLERVKNGKNN